MAWGYENDFNGIINRIILSKLWKVLLEQYFYG